MLILLNKVRNEKKMTLKELEKRTKISKSALNNFENNIRFPTMLHMEKIAKALDVKIIDLFESEFK